MREPQAYTGSARELASALQDLRRRVDDLEEAVAPSDVERLEGELRDVRSRIHELRTTNGDPADLDDLLELEGDLEAELEALLQE